MKMRSESQNTLRLYSGSPTRSDKDTVSISSFYYKERVRHTDVDTGLFSPVCPVFVGDVNNNNGRKLTRVQRDHKTEQGAVKRLVNSVDLCRNKEANLIFNTFLVPQHKETYTH